MKFWHDHCIAPRPVDGRSRSAIPALGLVTIAAYGAWFYAFGVLLDDVIADTGWSEGWVSGGFALSGIGGALLAPSAGARLDRVGATPLLLAAAACAALGLGVASLAENLVVFLAGGVVGGAGLSGLAFYHVTQPTALRLGGDPGRAVAELTIYGAFSSAVYLPIAGVLVDASGWRTTLQVLTAATVVVVAVGALVVADRGEEPSRAGERRSGAALRESSPGAGDPGVGRRRERPDLASVLDTEAARRYAAATVAAGLAAGTLVVYQVPLMVDAGLGLQLASTFAGARGVAQLLGRLPLSLIERRLGARGGLRLAFTAIGLGALLVPLAGVVPVAILFVAVTGFGLGATSPLQGLYANELFPRHRLGASMGSISMLFGLSSAAGPAVVGILADLTGTRWWAVGIVVVAAVIATLLIRPVPGTGPNRPSGQSG